MAELSLKHVYKRYPNGFEAVKDFNLDVADKELSLIHIYNSGYNNQLQVLGTWSRWYRRC